MKLTYDPEHDIAYICFREKPEQVATIQVSEELNVDIAEDGSVYGIELLNANEQLNADHLKALLVVNQASGVSTTVPLTL
ncbi:MAG: DUF2283 domain-containing protein [Candidatus Hydrogenedentes bacterium]|nr:DUF2283 domain-containing protein [Candidatus Hydrogenedentota bacterium]